MLAGQMLSRVVAGHVQVMMICCSSRIRTLELSDKVVGATGGALVWSSQRSSNWLGDPSCPLMCCSTRYSLGLGGLSATTIASSCRYLIDIFWYQLEKNQRQIKKCHCCLQLE